jgi:putative addiction module component (TIGR02574 family)
MPINLAALKNLSIAEKLELIELLWRDIESSNEPFPLNPEILAEANRRAAELRADPSITIDREELWRRVDGKPLALPQIIAGAARLFDQARAYDRLMRRSQCSRATLRRN